MAMEQQYTYLEMSYYQKRNEGLTDCFFIIKQSPYIIYKT